MSTIETAGTDISTDLPCLVVDCTDSDQWPNRFVGPVAGLVPMPRRIPTVKAPTILQPTREMAGGEAKRGEVMASRHEPAVLQLGDAPDEIPF